MILTGENIRRAQLLAIEHGLQLQVRTDMGFTNNYMLHGAQRQLQAAGIRPGRTVKKVLTQFIAFRKEYEKKFA